MSDLATNGTTPATAVPAAADDPRDSDPDAGASGVRDRDLLVTPGTGPADDAGMATAEYAIATVAAAGFAGLLVVILRSGEVRELLLGIIRSALSL